jgi:hypothetical protein
VMNALVWYAANWAASWMKTSASRKNPHPEPS